MWVIGPVVIAKWRSEVNQNWFIRGRTWGTWWKYELYIYIDHIGSYWFSPTLRNIILNKVIIIPFQFPEVFCPPRVGVLAVRVLVRKGLDLSFFGDKFGWHTNAWERRTYPMEKHRQISQGYHVHSPTSPAHHFKSVAMKTASLISRVSAMMHANLLLITVCWTLSIQ